MEVKEEKGRNKRDVERERDVWRGGEGKGRKGEVWRGREVKGF